MEENKENLIQETTKSAEKDKGFEMTAEQARQITSELSKLNDAISHDKPISIDDLENLSKVARGTKIDVGGMIMTVEEAEKIPDSEINAEIFREIRKGKFDRVRELTMITPIIAAIYFRGKKTEDIEFYNLITAGGIVLPKSVKGSVCLHDLTTAKGLTLPEVVGKHLNLDRLPSPEGLVLPKTVKGFLNLNKLTSAEGLVFPDYIGEGLELYGLNSISDGVAKQLARFNCYMGIKPELKAKIAKFKK